MPPRAKRAKTDDATTLVKLSYWGGRGLMEVPRFCYAIAGKEVEDVMVSGTSDMGSTLDCNLGRVPLLECAEGGIGQSAAINFYAASECDLLGSSTFETAQVIAFTEHIKELKTAYGSLVPFGKEPTAESIATFFDTDVATDFSGPADSSKRSSRYLKWFMGRMEGLVGDDGFAVGGKLTLADVMLYNTFADTLDDGALANKALPSYRREPFGSAEKTTAELEKHPKLKACVASVAEHANVAKYVEARSKSGRYNF